MRVFVGPHNDPGLGGTMVEAARSLAGPGGHVISLRDVGVRNLRRRLSSAEVALLRQAFGRDDPAIGYMCQGSAAGAAAAETPLAAVAVAVTDHADLTWRSPLAGANDDTVGPRFPSLAGVYAPDLVLDRLGGREGMIVRSGVVAGVADDAALLSFEATVMAEQGWMAASAELVAPVIVAAHMGLRVAAVVMIP
jgi:hypothetical protein